MKTGALEGTQLHSNLTPASLCSRKKYHWILEKNIGPNPTLNTRQLQFLYISKRKANNLTKTLSFKNEKLYFLKNKKREI